MAFENVRPFRLDTSGFDNALSGFFGAVKQRGIEDATSELAGLTQQGAGRNALMDWAKRNPAHPSAQQFTNALARNTISPPQADPVNDEMKRLRVEELKARIAQMRNPQPNVADTPSNIREWQAYQQMPPEQRAEYIRMKRANPYLDTGTEFTQPNPVDPTAQPRIIPKNLAEAEKQKEVGTAAGKAEAAAPSDVTAAQNAADILTSIRNDPALEKSTGMSSIMNSVWGTEGYGFEQKVQQAKSGAFLTAIQQLRGLGALSNAEGQTATAAVTRMNTALRKEDFLAALNDYEKVVNQGLQAAQGRIQSRNVPIAPAGGAQVSPQAIEALRANANNPQIIQQFEQKYGVPAAQFLGR